jgi:hypothetical protein
MVCYATRVAVTLHVRETVSAYIHAAEHRFLTLIAEYDRLRGWELGGHRSCAHWLAPVSTLEPVGRE